MKGGVGKTTLAVNLACLLKENGQGDVTVLDLDAQASSKNWIEIAQLPVRVLTEGRPAELKGSGGDFLICDTPGNLHEPATQQAIQAADIVVIPCTPSPSDLAPTQRTVNAVRELTKAPAVVVLNRVREGTVTARMAEDWVRDLGIPVIKTHLRNREYYQQTFLTGWARDGEGREDLEAVVLALLKLLR